MRAFVIVPHQDDEINLVGNILDRITSEYETFVVYSSLESNEITAQMRAEEAYNACRLYGIDCNHVIFLKYPDTSNKEKNHFFTNGDKSIVSKLGSIILEYKPNLIFVNDFDYHSDHRMLSLAFDEAMGIVLKSHPEYRPDVLKGFCYETAYYGVRDYRASSVGRTKCSCKILPNSSYEWENRVSILSRENRGVIWSRKVYKALRCHRSQYAILHAQSIINADNVFWRRRTDNLMLLAQIETESGDVSKLNDFMIVDTNDIITIDPRVIDFSKGLWKPNNKSCRVHVRWDDKVRINRMVFHGNPAREEDSEVLIQISSKSCGQIAEISCIRGFGRDTVVSFNEIETDNVELTLISLNDEIELSEIEAFSGEIELLKLEEENINVLRVNNVLLDLVDKIGYNCIVFATKAQRKLRKSGVMGFKNES